MYINTIKVYKGNMKKETINILIQQRHWCTANAIKLKFINQSTKKYIYTSNMHTIKYNIFLFTCTYNLFYRHRKNRATI